MIKKIVSRHYEQLDVMHLETQMSCINPQKKKNDLPKFTQEEMGNVNSHIIKEIESKVKNFLWKNQAQSVLSAISNTYSKNK